MIKPEIVLIFTDKILTPRGGKEYNRAVPPPAGILPVILVTGASRGLGRGVALQLAAQGYSVAINYAGNQPAALEAARLCEAAAKDPRQKFIPLQADIRSGDERERLLKDVWSLFGRLDGLVNNAGVAPKVRADILE